MPQEIEITITWDRANTEYLPSALLGIPRAKELKQPAEVPRIGTFTVLDDTRGDQHGGLWDAVLWGVLTITGGVTSSMIANWLWDRVKQGQAKTLEINRRRVTLEVDSIRIAIEETSIKRAKTAAKPGYGDQGDQPNRATKKGAKKGSKSTTKKAGKKAAKK